MKWFLIFYVVYLYRAPRLVATLLRLPPSSSSDDKESWISVSYFYKAFWSVFSAVVFGTLVTATISLARQVVLKLLQAWTTSKNRLGVRDLHASS